jgi:GNAT superfamily N-acetyltransferase
VTSTDPALLIRPADAGDVELLAALHLAARDAAVPAMPPPLHTLEETQDWMGLRLAGTHELWVAEEEGTTVGYLALSLTGQEQWLDDLYVVPDRTGQGIGAALLDLAKALRRDGFSLWVFVSNEGARRFYRSHGLVEVEFTDGSGNEERAPDVRMTWAGSRGQHDLEVLAVPDLEPAPATTPGGVGDPGELAQDGRGGSA